MTKKIKKNSLIALGALLALTLPVSVSLLQASADDTQTTVTPVAIEEANFAMDEGAAARLAATDNYGLKFSATLSESDYKGIMANTAYTDVEFGMLVMPFDYVAKYGELSKKNVFETPVYDWATYNGTDWDYTSAGKTRIINVSSSVMQVAKDGSYYIEGAVKKILPDNIARDFIGRAYIKYTEGAEVKYEMADWYDTQESNNVRSIAYVAQMAIADNGPDACSTTDKDWMQANYVDKVLVDETKADYAYIDRSKTVSEHTFTTPANATALRVTTEDYSAVPFTATDGGFTLTEDLIAGGLTASVLKKGENTVYVHTVDTTGATPVYKVYKECIVIADKVLMQSEFTGTLGGPAVKALFYPYYTGYIVLGEDIDMGNCTYRVFSDSESIGGVLKGTFDGRGHKLTVRLSVSRASFLAKNYGTIQNMFVDIIGTDKKAEYHGFIDENYGNVNNVMAKLTYKCAPNAGYGGTLVGHNMSGGTVTNCIGEVGTASTYSNFQVGTIVGSDLNGGHVNVVRYCYGITNGFTSGNQSNGKEVVLSSTSGSCCDVNTCEVYENYSVFTEDVTSLPAADGWSKFWSLSNGTLKLGNNVIYTPATV